MPSDLAKFVAGTFVPDTGGKAKGHPVLEWFQQECRNGSLREKIKEFAASQPEFVDPALVLVESILPDSVECTIPVRESDHESTKTFLTEVRFKLNPSTGQACRI